MKLYKTFLFPVFLLASCTASQSVSSGNNNVGASKGSMRNLNTADSTSNLQGAAIDRNKLNAVPIRIKNMNPDSIPKP